MNFEGLFIYDMANNHQGDLAHGLRIIKDFAALSKEKGVRGAMKFQYRQLATFIHPDYRDYEGNKHLSRFISTELSPDDYGVLAASAKEQGLITVSTPFDEESVDLIEKLRIDIIKIASCSAQDWPLLERIAEAGKPVICSTAGLNITQIDDIVSFFEKHGTEFALMHCVAIYPTPFDKLALNQVKLLLRRYPHITIGFSTHEDPDCLDAVKIAYAKGARIFERHVGVNTDKYKLNGYSSTPEQAGRWIDSYKETLEACGPSGRAPVSHLEEASLESLSRGVFLKNPVAEGEMITRDNVVFSMPILKGQLKSGLWSEGLVADKDYKTAEPVPASLRSITLSRQDTVNRIILQVKGMLNNARIFLGDDCSVELSHHYGLDRFREFGAVIIDCINRDYCKKLIIQLPRQKHPYHYHKKKEETFQVLSGSVEVELEGETRTMLPGDKCLVERDKWHKFQTLHGVIFEEVSTTHFNNDSFYEDPLISEIPRESRKTKIDLGLRLPVNSEPLEIEDDKSNCL